MSASDPSPGADLESVVHQGELLSQWTPPANGKIVDDIDIPDPPHPNPWANAGTRKMDLMVANKDEDSLESK